MLIRAIRAENFLRFGHLELENLPTEGVIGVEGPNESGKSSLAEALVFAFYGRGRSADVPVTDLIRWGENHLMVEVDFEIRRCSGEPEGSSPPRSLRLRRQIDRLGSNFAQLETLDGEEVAVGLLQVSEFLSGVLGFDAEEFQSTFCQRQGEASLGADGRVLRDQLERLTGISNLQGAAEELRREVREHEREFGRYQREILRNLEQIGRHAAGAERLDEVEGALEQAIQRSDALLEQQSERRDRREHLAGLIERSEKHCARLGKLKKASLTELSDALPGLLGEYEASVAASLSPGDSAATDPLAEKLLEGRNRLRKLDVALTEVLGVAGTLEEDLSALQSDVDEEREGTLAARRRELSDRVLRGAGWLTLLCVLCFLVATAAGLGWRFHDQLVENPWTEAIRRWWPGSTERLRSLLGWVGLGCLIGGVAAGVWALARRAAARTRAQELAELEREIAEASARAGAYEASLAALAAGRVEEFVEQATPHADGELAQRLEEARGRYRSVLKKQNSLAGWLGDVRAEETRALEKTQGEISSLEKKLKDGEQKGRKLGSERDRSENEVRDCRSHIARREAVEEANEELDSRARIVRREIDDRLLAIELLEGTITQIRLELAPSLRALVRQVLPRMTADRYRDVRLSDGLDVELYSTERGDFVPPSHLSGGTVEGLLLALRLAFSQAAVSARVRRPHFIFLDEPFRMMDADRALESLSVLRRLSPDLSQFFVVQPVFTESQREHFQAWLPTRSATDPDLVFQAARLGS